MTGRKAAPRRRWTAEQKRAIVAESLVVGGSVAGVARRHAITADQIYAWRQQLLQASLRPAGDIMQSDLQGDMPETAVATSSPSPDLAAAALPP